MTKRIARTLPLGATVAEGKTTWLKAHDRQWWDLNTCRDEATDVDIDIKLATGQAQVIKEVIDLPVEMAPAWELAAGEYVVLTYGFWMEGQGVEYFVDDEYVAQELWRVGGWTEHRGDLSWMLLDTNESLMRKTNFFMSNGETFDIEPLIVPITADDKFRVVVPGAVREGWDYDWELDHRLYPPRV